MKVAFVLTAHLPTDERVFYHQKPALEKEGCEVHIISTQTGELHESQFHCFSDKEIPKKKVVRKISRLLQEIEPDIVICDTPISILGAALFRKKYKKKIKIFYDITEFYPSQKNLTGLNTFVSAAKYVTLLLVNFFSDLQVDGFIFGEYYKSMPYHHVFPFTPYIFLSYYPDLKFFKHYPRQDLTKNCNLIYCGNLTEDKGYDKVLEVACQSALKHPEVHFTLTVVHYTKPTLFLEQHPDNLEINFSPFKPFTEFCNEIGQYDIYLDLRKITRENNRCLPIKIFYYMACSRAVIFSNLKAIRHDLSEINEFGHLVNPNNITNIVNIISQYITHPDLYNKHCDRSFELSQSKYHWGLIEKRFTDFVLRNEHFKY